MVVVTGHRYVHRASPALRGGRLCLFSINLRDTPGYNCQQKPAQQNAEHWSPEVALASLVFGDVFGRKLLTWRGVMARATSADWRADRDLPPGRDMNPLEDPSQSPTCRTKLDSAKLDQKSPPLTGRAADEIWNRRKGSAKRHGSTRERGSKHVLLPKRSPLPSSRPVRAAGPTVAMVHHYLIAGWSRH